MISILSQNMIMTWNESIVALFLLAGVSFILIANIGILIMPNTLCRSHALSKAVTLGLLLMLIGLWINLGREAVGLKVLLALAFQFTTIPISGHLFAYYTAYHSSSKEEDIF